MNSILAWLSIWSLAAGWLLLSGFFLPPDSRGWAFSGLGCALAVLAARNVRWRQIDPWLFALAVPLGMASLLWPSPYRAGPLLALAGLLLALGLGRARWLTPLCVGLSLTGAVWIAQSGAVVAYWHLGSRYHEVGVLTPLLQGLGRTLGWTVGGIQGSFFLPHIEGMVQATPTWERLGALPVMLLGAGGLVLLPLLQRQSARDLWLRLGMAGILGFGYMLLRYLILTAAVAINNNPMAFWLPVSMALTFLPLSLVLARILPLRTSMPEPQPTPGHRPVGRYVSLAGLTFLGSICLVALLMFPDPGKLKAGRVLLDEYNSNWEWTTQALDTEWYGQKSGYNYYSLGQWLRHYYQVDTNFQPRTPENLGNYDVLIIKTPTAPFDSEELEAITAWVRAGGGLFLIGDHTNVFGTSSYLNPLAQRFGLRFRYDSTYDLPTLRVTQYKRPKVLAHPVVLEMPAFLFATSCTLEAPLLAGNVMVGYQLRALPVDYSKRVFFPDKEKEQDYPFGLFLQSASVRHGRGRVVAFTDSTVFSNFTMFLGGKPEYFLGAMNWLNHAERFPWLRGGLMALAVLACLGAGYLGAHLNRWRAGIVILAAFLLALAIGPWACLQVAESTYRLPEPHTDPTRIAFEAEHSRIRLPTAPAGSPPEASYQTFYVWTQRLGYIPSFSPTLEQALGEDARVLVIIDPFRPFEPAEIAAVEGFVSRGGRLLIMAEPAENSQWSSSAAELLAPFGLGMDARRPTNGEIHNMDRESQGRLYVGGVVSGGEPLLTLGGQAPVAAVAGHGDGLVVAVAFGQPFSDREMGSTSVIPDDHQRFLYEIEFWLLRGLVSGNFPPLRAPATGGQ